MLSFQITLHAKPPAVVPGPTLALSGRTVQTLQVAPDVLAATSMDRSFEEASAALTALERMYCEPDGSFVWTSSRDEPAWQVDGNLYDRDGRLLFVDLNGSCPCDRFDRLLAAFGGPDARFVVQLTREAVLLGEAEFRRFAARSRERA